MKIHQMIRYTAVERLGLVLAGAGYDGQPLGPVDPGPLRLAAGNSPRTHGQWRLYPCPTRWVVERFISWLRWDRRLSRDDECETTAAEATIHLSSIRHFIRKF